MEPQPPTPSRNSQLIGMSRSRRAVMRPSLIQRVERSRKVRPLVEK